jgi:hypothetical protein
MVQKISMKEVERKVFRTTLQDGLWDIFIGCFVLMFAIAPLLSNRLGDFWSSAIFLPFLGLVYGIIWLVRKSVVAPRLGSVKFGPARKTQMVKFTLVMFSINLVALVAGIFFATHFDVSAGLLYMMTFGFIVLALSSIAAYFLECIRFFIYGFLFVLSLVIGEWLFANYKVVHHGFPITFGLTTFVILISGIFLFLRFLQHYPIPATEPTSEEQAK